MFNFKFSIYGTGAFIMLFLISFVFNWVIKVNHKNKYRHIRANLETNAIKIGKSYLDINHQKAHFKIRTKRFWNSIYAHKEIHLEKEDFYGNSLYSLQEILFRAMMQIKKIPWIIKNELISKIVLFLVQLILLISLIMGFWIGALTSALVFFIIFIVELLLTFSFFTKINNQVLWLLQKNGISLKMAKKSFWLNRFYILDKYISVFSESYIATAILFKKWGEDE